MDCFKLLNGVSPANGGTGDWHAPKGKRPGKWMPAIPNPVPCKRGYHVVTSDHVLDWSGTDLWRVEVRGEVIDHDDKLVVEQARLLSRVEGWTPTNMRLFAALCAAAVLHVFESARPGDDRPRKAIDVAAAPAAYAAAYTAAPAAYAAAYAAAPAARAAAYAAARAARAAAYTAAYAAAYAADAAAYAAAPAARAAAYAARASYAAPAAREWQREHLGLMLTLPAPEVEATYRQLIDGYLA